MMTFHDFLHHRLESGGFTTEDALASVLPLMRQVAAAHRAGLVAPLEGLKDLQVEGVRIWFPEARLRPPAANAAKVREIDQPVTGAVHTDGSGPFGTMPVGLIWSCVR